MPAAAQAALVDALTRGIPAAGSLPERERALLAYAEQLTANPASIGPGDVAQLRRAGLDDRAIHDACAVVSYFAFVNRIADGLGVELEDGATGADAADQADGG
jgi:uncharacterized peroxidase-related enzyme